MSNLIERVKQKQKEIQNLQKEATKKAGRKEQLFKQLKTEFDISTKEEAQILLNELEKVRKENELDLETIKEKLEEIISSAKYGTVS